MTTFDNKVLTSQNPVWLKHNDYNVFGGPLKACNKKSPADTNTNNPLKSFRKSIDLSKISKKPKTTTVPLEAKPTLTPQNSQLKSELEMDMDTTEDTKEPGNNQDSSSTAKISTENSIETSTYFSLPALNRILLRFFDIKDHTKSIVLPDIFININGFPIEPERQDTPAMLPGEVDLTDAVHEFKETIEAFISRTEKSEDEKMDTSIDKSIENSDAVKNMDITEVANTETHKNNNNLETNSDKFKLEIFWSTETKDIEYGWCLFIAEKVEYDKLPICYNENTFDVTYYPERVKNGLKRRDSRESREKSRESRSDSRNSGDRNTGDRVNDDKHVRSNDFDRTAKRPKYSHEDEGYFDANRDGRPKIRDERPTIRDHRDNKDVRYQRDSKNITDSRDNRDNRNTNPRDRDQSRDHNRDSRENNNRDSLENRQPVVRDSREARESREMVRDREANNLPRDFRDSREIRDRNPDGRNPESRNPDSRNPDARDVRDSRETSSNESNYSANYMIEAISDPDLGRVEEERVKRFIELATKQKIAEFIDGIIATNYALEHCVHYRKTYIIQKLFDCRNVEMKMKEKLAKHIIHSQKDAVFYLARHNVGNFALRELIHCVEDDGIINEILESLKPDLIELSSNKFGCFIVQSLVNSLCDRDFVEMKKHFIGHRRLMNTICNSYGSRTMQKMISRMEYKELVGFVKVVKGDLIEMACDQHGTYLVQKLLDLLDNDDIFHYFSTIIDNPLDGLRDCIDSFAGRTMLRKLLPRLPSSYINKYKDKLSHSYYQQVTTLLKQAG